MSHVSGYVRGIAVCGMLTMFGTAAMASPFTSSQSGNWNLSSTWGGAGVPGAADTVTITGSHVVTVSDLRNALSVTLDSTAGSKVLTVVSGGTLIVQSAVQPAISINMPSSGGTNIVRIDGGILQTTNAGIQITGGTSEVAELAFTSLGGTATIAGDVLFSGSAANAQIDMAAAAANLEIGGDLGNGGTLINNAGSKVRFNGSGSQTINSYTFAKLEIDKSGTAALNGPVTVIAELNVNSGVLDDGGYQISLDPGLGTFVTVGSTGVLKLGSAASATDFPTPLGTVNLLGGSAVVYQAGVAQPINTDVTYRRLYVSTMSATPVTKGLSGLTLNVLTQLDVTDNGPGLVTLDVGGNALDLDGNITGDGSITLSGGSINIAGDWGTSVGLTAPSGIVIYDGSGSQNVLGANYFNLDINKSAGTATLTGNTTVSGNLGILSFGTLNVGSNTLTLLGNTTSNSVLSALTGTVRFNGTSAQTFDNFFSPFSVQNLEINNATGVAISAQGTLVNGTLTLNGGNLDVTGSLEFTVATTATIARTSGWIIGYLTMGMNPTPARTFPIGTAASYLPVTADANAAGMLAIAAIEGLHPDRTGPNVLDRFWRISPNTTVTLLDSITFQYNNGDVSYGDDADSILAQYDGGSLLFTHYGLVNAPANTGSTTGVTGIETDWVIGEPGSLAAASKLAITSINGGTDPTPNVPFSIVVESRDDNGDPAPVFVDTTFQIYEDNGSGSIGGTPTGTILAGTDNITVSGVTYDTAETGLQMRVIALIGDDLLDGTAPFDMAAAPSTLTVSSLGDSGPGTLRDAITTHNGGGCTTPCTIDFSVSGEISLATALPAITMGDVTIDGYTAPAALANTATFGLASNASLTVAVDGGNSVAFGFDVQATNVKIVGLGIKRFATAGVRFTGTNTGSNVSGCHIGTDLSGTGFAANGIGVLFSSSTGASLGGMLPAARNVISGNTGWGVSIDSTTATVSLIGNYIGVRRDLANVLANNGGVLVSAGSTAISVGVTGIGNVISGNTTAGIELAGSNAVVKSNFIGTAGSGAAAFANNTGIQIDAAATFNTIGGPLTDSNVISGNTQNGILISGDDNTIDNNSIGITPDGLTARPNGASGIRLDTTASRNLIGTTLGNKIANNANDGVTVATTAAGIGNVVRRNKIAANVNRAIDLTDDGTTANDLTDSDTGANNLQNFPTLLSAKKNGGNIDVRFSLDSSGGVSANFFVIEAFKADGSSPAQAAAYLGGSGCLAGSTFANVLFSVPAGATVTGDFVVATATAYSDAACSTPSEGTSELSPSTRVSGEIHWNTGNGNWENGANWSPTIVPTSTDDAYIDAPGTYTVGINTIASVASVQVGAATGTQILSIPTSQSLTFTNASSVGANGTISFSGINLGGSGLLGVTGTLDWNSGALSGAGGVTINSGGTLNLATPASKFITSSLLTIASGANAYWTGGQINLVTGGAVDNFGLFECKTDQAFADGGAPGTFDNAGTFRKSITGGSTTFNNVTFNHNGGTVDMLTGTLDLAGGTASAPFTLAVGTSVLVNDNTYDFATGTGVTGAGKVHINGGTLNVSGTAVTIENLLLATGFLGGTGTAQTGASGNWIWSSGNMTGSGTSLIQTGAVMQINSASAKSLISRTLSIQSGVTVTWLGTGPIQLQTGGNISNAGTLDAQDDGAITDAGGAGGFVNSGTFKKSAGAGTTGITNVAFTNTGTVQVQTGTLNPSLVTNSGAIQLTGTLLIDDNTVTLNGASDVSGAGLLRINGGTLAVDVADTLPNVQLDGGFLQGTATFSITSLDWKTGSMQGSGTTNIPNPGSATLSTASAKSLQRTFDIASGTTVSVTGTGPVNMSAGGNVSNAGIFDFTVDGSLSDAGGDGGFLNTGTLRKSGGAGTASLTNVDLTSSGTIDIQTGTFNPGNVTSTGPIQLAGTFLVDDNTVTFNAGTDVSGAGLLKQTAAFLNANAVDTFPNVQIDGGTFQGTANVSITALTWTNGIMDGAGTTTIPSGATAALNTPSGKTLRRTLSIVNGGTVNVSGGGPVTLQSGGNIANDGTLDVNSTNLSDGGAGGDLVNTRTFRSNGPVTLGNLTLNNNGGTALIDIQSGTLDLADGTSSGAIAIANTAFALINSDTYTLATGTTVSGAGTVSLTAGTLSVTGNISIANLNQSGGILDGTGALTLTGTSIWNNGNMQGAGSTSVSGVLNLSGASGKNLTRLLSTTSTGAINLNGTGTINIGAGGSITNAGTFTTTVDSSISDAGSGGNFTNSGATSVFRKQTATGTTFFTGIAFTNNGGLVDLKSGILNITNDPFTQTSGKLKLWLGGTSPGIGFSQITTDQSPALAGELEIALVGLYQPIGGDSFLVLGATTHSGDFAPYTYPSLAAGRTFSNAYTGSGLLLTVNGEGDLALTKSGPSNVLVGAPIAYTIQVDNNGPDTANTLSVIDTLAAGHNAITAAGTGWTCNVVSSTVTCTMPTLAVGSASPITINATAPGGPVTFPNSATVTSSNDSNTGDNSDSISVTVDPYQADLELSATSPVAPLAPSTAFQFDFTVKNNGPQTATGVTFSAPVPATIQYDGATPDAGTCNYAANTVTCTLGSILSGTDVHVVLDLTTIDPGTHSITGTGAATEIDPNTGNESISPAVSVTGSSLTVTNTDDTGAGSLRQALEDANNGVCTLPCAIDFNIGSGPFIIQPATELPAIGNQVLLDATTQPGYSGSPIIEIDAAPANLIAGLTLAGTGSGIKGFSIQGANIGVKIAGDSNSVEGNYIGITPSEVAGANLDGIEITGDNNVVGGSSASQRNIISGNVNHGVLLSGIATGNTVAGNYIGTDVAGTSAIPQNTGVEIIDEASSNTIGGTTAADGNVIAGNSNYAIYMEGSGGGGIDDNAIYNNAIGVDSSGTATLGASIAGIAVIDDAVGTQIGAPDKPNVIGGNGVGIHLAGSVEQTTIAANQIGRALDQVTNVANSGSGIVLEASNNLVGGGLFNGHNNIANNGNDGITVLSGTENRLLVNSIFDNTDQGIDLGDDGPTANDIGDADTGANNLQNSPTLTSVSLLGGGDVHVAFNFDSSASGTGIGSVRVEMFEADTNGQGKYFFNVGCHAVNAAGIGSSFNAPSITAGMPVVLTMTSYTDASCTNIADGTSEFSNVVTATTCTPPAVTITGPTTSCAGGTVMLDAGSGFDEYLWSTGEITQQITVAPTGTTIYSVTVKDGIGCSNSDTHTVNVNPLPTPAITGPTSVCATGSVTLDAGGGYSGYLWSNGAVSQTINVSPASTTNYSVTVTDGNGCQGTDSHTVTVNANPTVTITGPTSTCASTNIVLDAGPGFASYSWSTGDLTRQITVAPTINTVYSVTVTDGNGCTATDTHNVSVNALPTATITPGGPTTFCAGGNVVLTASPAASWLWSNGATSQNITVNATGSYSVQVTSAAGCSATSAPTSVTVNPAPVVTITGPTSSCASAPVLLDAGSGFASYLWSNGATSQTITVSPAATATYSVTVTDGSSCSGSDSHTVTVSANPTATISVAASVCQGSTGNAASVAIQPGATYTWSIVNGTITGGAGTHAITFTAGASGTVDLGITINAGACTSSGTANVPIVPPPTVTITGPTSACANANSTLDAGAGFATYVWSNGATTPTITVSPDFTTTYTVNVTTAGGCAATDSHTVTVTPAPTPVITAPGSTAPNTAGLAASVVVVPGATYNWTVLNGTLTSGNGTNAIVFAAGASGVTELNVSVNAGGCTGTSQHFVFIESDGTGADLVLTKAATASVAPGGTIVYTLGITNLGPQAATDVVLADTLPAGTTFVSVNGGPWTCAQTLSGIRCTGNAAAGSSSSVLLTVNAPQSTGTVTNTAQITSAVSDPHPANNSASAVTSVVTAPPPTEGCTNLPVVNPISPANNGIVNASSVQFVWSTASGADGYRLFASIDGAIPALLGITRETTLRLTIARGDVVWFVQALYDGCAATESQRFHFTIPTRNDCNPNQKPQTLSPADASTTGNGTVTFTWSSVPGAIEYELWLSLDNGSPVLFGSTAGTTLTEQVPPGKLLWYVRAIVDRCGARDSQRARFTYAQPAECATFERPIPITPLFGAISDSPLSFRWSNVGASGYDVYVRRGDALTLVTQTSTTTTANNVSLAPGKLRWFVRAHFPDNCAPLDSAEQDLEIVATPAACATLGAPIIAAPGQISSDVPFLIQWKPVLGATSYQLQVADNAGFSGAETLQVNGTLRELTRTNLGTQPLSLFARVRAIGGRCEPDTVGAYGSTAAVFILPNGSSNGSAPVIGGDVTFTIQLGPELAGQMFNAAPRQPWLTVTPESGFVRAGGTTLTVLAHTTSLPLGTSLGAVVVTLGSTSAGGVTTHDNTSVSSSFSVSLVTPVAPEPSNTPPPDALIIPAIAHADGINSRFQSDVRVSNTSPRLVNYRLTYTPSGQGIEAGQQTTFAVEPGRTIALDDILQGFFGTGSGNAIGTLEIRPLTETTDSTSSAPLSGLLNLVSFASSRTFNVTANGTFGQYIPAIPFANFIGRAAAGDLRRVLSLQQIAQSAQYRTNLGLMEGSGSPASVIVRIFGNAGEYLTEFPVELKGGQHVQLNSFLRDQGVDPLTDGRVEVEVMSEGGKVTAYASVLDNATSDPLLVTPVSIADSGASKWVVPGVADLVSGFGNWQTDMRLFNAGNEAVDATLLFYSQNGGEPKTNTITIPAGQVRQFDRALASLFNTSNDGGAVHITTPAAARLIATARTYNQTTGGTYGQFISAVTLAEAAGIDSRPLQLLQVEESDRFRSNIGLVEVSGKPVTLELSIVPPDAKFTAVTEIPLAANEFRQLGSLLASFGLDDTHNARVTVRVIGGEGRITAYASVIDMQTNDPTYVPAQ
ncbi:MAG: hypothetical protein ABI779_04940 [Acidobacteriota bacterium]